MSDVIKLVPPSVDALAEVTEVLTEALARADEFKSVIVLGMSHETEPLCWVSAMTIADKCFLAAYLQADIQKWMLDLGDE